MPKGDRAILKADPLDGTTPVSHLLLEALAMAKISGREKGAVVYLWRKTYGWVKGGVRLKEERITLRQWAEGLDITEANASRIITGLVRHNIIKQISLGQGKGYIYSTNTNIATWNGDCINRQALSKMITLIAEATLVENDKATLVENDKATLVENDNPIVPAKSILNKDLNQLVDGGVNEMIKGNIQEILDEIRKLPTWKTKDSDILWVNEIIQEFPNIGISTIRKCRDWHLGHNPKKKHIWKSALRNWMEVEEKTPKKAKYMGKGYNAMPTIYESPGTFFDKQPRLQKVEK